MKAAALSPGNTHGVTISAEHGRGACPVARRAEKVRRPTFRRQPLAESRYALPGGFEDPREQRLGRDSIPQEIYPQAE